MKKNTITSLDIKSKAISDFNEKHIIHSNKIKNAIQEFNKMQCTVNRAMERIMQGDLSVNHAMEQMMQGELSVKHAMGRMMHGLDARNYADSASINEFDYIFKNVDAEAAILFLGYLQSSFNDPEIKKSEVTSGVIAMLIKVFGELDCNTSSDKKYIETELGFSARSATNKENSKKPRFPEKYDAASDVCKKWFSDPSVYKTKSAFYLDIVEKGFCKDTGTVADWLKKFIRDSNPGAAWLKKFGPKISG